MRNPAFTADLEAWAALHGLRPSRRTPCGHALLGRGLKSAAHERYCVGERSRLLDHATVWNRDGRPLVVIAFPFGPVPTEPEHAGHWSLVQEYATRLGIAAFTPDAKNPLHRLYDSGACVALYSRRDTDLRPLSLGVQRTRVLRGGAVYPARYRRGGAAR
jgi:hypothetical protein